MNDDETKKAAKGWKQLKALELINSHPEGGTFEELTSLVAEACFPETFTVEWIGEVIRPKHPGANEDYIQNRASHLREGKARHLVRYLFKFQDKPDPQSGKKETLRGQGRIILPGKEVIIRESMSSVIDTETGKARAGTAKPKRAAPVKLPESEKPAAPLTPDRLAMFRKASANLKTKNTAAEIAKLAQQGAHRFKGTMVKNETEVEETPESEAQEA